MHQKNNHSTYFNTFNFSESSGKLSKKMRVAIIGQSPFAAEVYRSILKDGHKIAGIFTVLDKNGKQVRHRNPNNR